MPRQPRPLSDLLADSRSGLGKLAAGAAQRSTLLRQVGACLPPELAARVTGVNLREDTLVLLTDSAAWATRLRYAGPALRESLSRLHSVQARKVTVKVRAPGPAVTSRDGG